MPRPSAVAVVAEERIAPAAGAAGGRAVDTLRARLAGRAAREHVVLDFLDDDLEQARGALAAIATYVASIDAALTDEEPSQQRILSLALGGGPIDRIERLGAALASVRRRLAQVAARM